jgi:hypothetical protein
VEVRAKKQWFEHVMAERDRFYDLGFTAIFLGYPHVILFWKCIPEGEEPWLSSQNQ